MPQVTAVDGQFGTHTRQATLTRQTRNPLNHPPGKINRIIAPIPGQTGQV
jgi:hypothetical protein